MEDRSAERRAIARRVLTALRHKSVRNALSVRNAAGERPIVAVLPDDSVLDVFRWVDEQGGAANVVVQLSGKLVNIGIGGPGPCRHEDADDEHSPEFLEVSAQSHVEMLVLGVMQEGQGRPVPCRVKFPDGTVRELGGGDQLMVPA